MCSRLDAGGHGEPQRVNVHVRRGEVAYSIDLCFSGVDIYHASTCPKAMTIWNFYRVTSRDLANTNTVSADSHRQNAISWQVMSFRCVAAFERNLPWALDRGLEVAVGRDALF